MSKFAKFMKVNKVAKEDRFVMKTVSPLNGNSVISVQRKMNPFVKAVLLMFL